MTSYDLISHDIPFLKPTDQIYKAEELFQDLHIQRIPVVDDTTFIGWITPNMLDFLDRNQLISKISFPKEVHVLSSDVHFLDALKSLHVYETDMLPVYNHAQEYLGVISEKSILKYIESCGFVASPGGILVLSIKHQDYSISEIGRIIENNDMRLICLLVSNSTGALNEIELTLKLNKTDLSRLIATFERFGYTIKAEFHDNALDYHDSERLEMLLKYLSI